MNVLILVVALAAFFELLWASHPVLRAHRAHFRAMVAIFWGLTTLIWAGSAWGLLPAGLYFGGVPRFASDAATYHQQAQYVADGLRNGSIVPYVDWQVFSYSRVLGLIFYLFDNSRLAGGLFNVTFYMASVLSVFAIGRRLFGERAGLWAAWLAASWPVFLLYETQTLRWVTTTAGLHLLMAGTVLAMGRGRVYLPLLCGLAGFAVLLVDLPQFARIAYVVAFLQAAVLLVADLRLRAWPLRAARVVAMAVVMMAAYDWVWVQNVVPDVESSMPDFAEPPADRTDQAASGGRPGPPAAPESTLSRATGGRPGQEGGRARPGQRGPLGQVGLPEYLKVPSPRNELDRLVAPILSARSGYLRQNDELRRDGIPVGTMLDGPPLGGARDFIANLPAALALAILAPTPASLLSADNGASQMGPVVAVEMVAYYLLFVTMWIGIWQALFRGAESRLATLYVLLFTGVAYVIIGTVTMNGGTLHRFRLPYVVIHMVYAAPVLAAWLPALTQRLLKGRQ